MLSSSFVRYLLVSFFLVGVVTANNWALFTQPSHPLGDTAADMLLAEKISHHGYLLTGHYSRFGFHHPGPFFIYFSHYFEFLVKPLGLSQEGAWIMASSVLNILFTVLAGWLALEALGRRVRAIDLLVFSAVSLMYFSYLIGHLWMPYKIVMPYMAFMFSLVLILQGRVFALPVSALLASVLIHGYVVAVIFTLPLLALSLGYAYFMARIKVDRTFVQMVMAGALIGAFFFIPILADYLLNDPSNIRDILSSAKANERGSSLAEVVHVMGNIVLKNFAFMHLLAITTAAFFVVKTDLEVFKLYYGVFSLVTVVFLLFFVFVAPGPVQEFTGVFYWGAAIGFLAMLVMIPVSEVKFEKLGVFSPFAFFPVAFVFLHYLYQSPISMAENQDVKNAAEVLNYSRDPSEKVKLFHENHDMWPIIAGLMLELENQGVPVCSIKDDMAFLFTSDFVCAKSENANFILIAKQDCAESCLVTVKEYGVKKLSPQLKSGE